MALVFFPGRFLRGVAILFVLLMPAAVHATTVFKYRGADGTWHYTDQRPAAQQSVEVLQLFGAAPEQQRTVQVVVRGAPDRPRFYAINKNLAPVEVKFWLTDTDNVQPFAPISRVVAGGGEQLLAEPAPQAAGRPMRYRQQLRWQLGDPHARPDAEYLYTPPVPERGLFTIAQGFDGTYSHNTSGSRYAIDIGMPIGSAVRAARGGLVISVQDSHAGGGNSVAYRSQTNSVYVLHSDGTFGIYAHLRQHSALVRPGQTVRAGQIVAQSGNTGYSTGPHLHFAVLRNAGLRWASIPFTLAGPDGPVQPTRGLALGAADARLAGTP